MTTPSGDAVTPEPRRSVNLHATSSDQGTVNQFAGNQYNQVIVLPAPVQVVRSLRADIATFTGRSGELQRVAAVEVTEGLTIYAIDGMPGVGKTALAVHISHQLADRFPDGQFFVDLQRP